MNSLPPSANNVHRKPELPALTGLRFVAAIYVVLYHFVFPNIHTSILPLRNGLGSGYTAVGLFFVLSGFVLTYTYTSCAPVPIHRFSFWKARISRIYPAYLFAFALAAPFQISGSIHANGLRLGLAKLGLGSLSVLSLTQAWTPWTAWCWNIPAWSLSAEMFFYFCFPFCALVVSRLPRQTCFAAAVAIWLLGLLGPVIYCALWPVIPQPPFPMGQLALETNPVMRLPDFLIGMLVGRLFISGFRLRSSMVSISSLVALATIGLLVSFSSAIPRLLLSNGVVTPSAVLLIFALAHQKGSLAQVLSHPSLTALGEASYAIYILQFPLSYLLNLNERTFTAQRFSIYLITLMGVSLATFFSIEQPLRRRLRAVRSAENATPESRSGQRLIAHLPVGA